MLMKLLGKGGGIGRYARWMYGIMFCRTKAPITIPAHVRTNGATAGSGDGSKTGKAFGHQYTDLPLPFTV